MTYFSKKISSIPLLVSLTIFLQCINCSPNFEIRYDITDLASTGTHPLVDKTIYVGTFSDNRRRIPGNRDIGGICINAEKHYNSDSLSYQFSKMLALHLNALGLFRRVGFSNNRITEDYLLTGNIEVLKGMQEISKLRIIGFLLFGIPGLLAASAHRTKTEIEIVMTNIQIWENKTGRIILNIPEYRKIYQGRMQIDNYCWFIYDNVNLRIKEHIGSLAIEIKNRLLYPHNYEPVTMQRKSNFVKSEIFLKNGQKGTGNICKITDKYVIYNKSTGSPAIQILKTNISYIITNGDTLKLE